VVSWPQSYDTMERKQLNTRSNWEGRPTMRDNKGPVHIAVLLVLAALVSTSCTFQIINPPPPIEVALKSFHGRYITALGAEDGWMLTQETELLPCGRFTLHHLANGKITLETCYGRYITAPDSGDTRQDWILSQESKLGDCGQFDLYELGNDEVSFKTYAGRFFTAGVADDAGWEGELAWSVVAETVVLMDWERFTLLRKP
jgi:hypothetical protein